MIMQKSALNAWILVGGADFETEQFIERCTLTVGGKIECTAVELELGYKIDYPKMMHVFYDYCPQ